MWLVYNWNDSAECGFTVGNGTENDCIAFCNENVDYTYKYVNGGC